jgi:ABC-type bacteriocin/lantibiotic exporter with double-glycine peptidase domain
MSFHRAMPPYVHQHNLWWCWAACIEMLSRLAPQKYGGVQYQEDVRNDPDMQDYLTPEGGIEVQDGVPALVTLYDMQAQVWTMHNPTRQRIEQCLHYSHLFAVYQVTPGEASHFVVIHGIGRNTLYYMDPARGPRTAMLNDVESHPLIIAWKP